MSICLFLSACLIFPPVFFFICLLVSLSACLFSFLSAFLSVCLSCLSVFVYLPAYLSVCLSDCRSARPPAYRSVCLLVLPSVCLSIFCLYVCASALMSAYLSVCLFVCAREPILSVGLVFCRQFTCVSVTCFSTLPATAIRRLSALMTGGEIRKKLLSALYKPILAVCLANKNVCFD